MIEVLPTIPSTLSLWISLRASEATWPGSVCSVSIEYWIGRPLLPPLSLTQSKYAFAVFGMSVKSVPGCFVAIAPSLIGAPLAFLPLPRPHFDAAALSPPLGVELWAELPAPDELDELELEPPPPPPHAATSSATVATRAGRTERVRADLRSMGMAAPPPPASNGFTGVPARRARAEGCRRPAARASPGRPPGWRRGRAGGRLRAAG